MKSRHLRNCELVPVAIPMNFSDLSFCESTPELPEHRRWRRESLSDNHWRGAVCLSEAGETGKEERTWVLGFAVRIMRRGGSHISFLCEGEVPAHWRRFSVHWGVSLPLSCFLLSLWFYSSPPIRAVFWWVPICHPSPVTCGLSHFPHPIIYSLIPHQRPTMHRVLLYALFQIRLAFSLIFPVIPGR